MLKLRKMSTAATCAKDVPTGYTKVLIHYFISKLIYLDGTEKRVGRVLWIDNNGFYLLVYSLLSVSLSSARLYCRD